MRREPRPTHVPVGPHRVARMQSHGTRHRPDVGIVSQTPAAVHTIISLRRQLARALQLLHIGKERLVHLGQPRRLGSPVVLLHVDVAGIVARPGWQYRLVPQSLQVGRHVGRARTTNQQIASILEIEGLQLRVKAALVHIVPQHLVGGTVIRHRLAQAQFYTIIDSLVVTHVASSQFLERHARESLQPCVGQRLVGLSLLHRVLVITIKRGCIDDIERNLACAIHHDVLTLSPRVLATHQHLSAEVDAAPRVIGKLLLGIIIAGQRCIAGIAVSNEGIPVLYAATMSQLTTQGEAGPDALGVRCGDAYHHARVGVRGKILRGVAIAPALITGVCRRITDVQPAPIIRHRRHRVQVLNSQLPQWLVVLREMALHLALQLVSLLVVTLSQGFAYGGNSLVGIGRIDVHVAGLTRPQRDVVERDAVGLGTTIDDAAHGAVAYHQRLLEIVGRPVIVQRLCPAREGHQRPS